MSEDFGRPFRALEKISLNKEDEGRYIDLYELKNNPNWVVKEQKDKRAVPEEYFERELNITKTALRLARKYLRDALPQTYIVMGAADKEQNKYNNPKKLFFAQERIDGKSLYHSDEKTIASHKEELDAMLAGIVEIYTHSLSEKYLGKENDDVGIMMDFHLDNVMMGKKRSGKKDDPERTWLIDVFPATEFHRKEFLKLAELRMAKPLLHKGIDIKNSDEFPRFNRALEGFIEIERKER